MKLNIILNMMQTITSKGFIPIPFQNLIIMNLVTLEKKAD